MDDFHDTGSVPSTGASAGRRGRVPAWESATSSGRGVRWAAALALALGLAACTVVDEAVMTPEERAAQQPQRVSTEGVKDEFPNLSEVPDEPRPYTAPEVRDEMVTGLSADREQALYTEPPLTTAASGTPDPFASSTIISSEAVTTTTQVVGLSNAAAASQGQLAAIIFFGHGSIELDGGDRGVLNDLVTLHRQRGGSLRVIGHASSRTGNTTPDQHQVKNFEMSLKRANAVSSELLRLGVSPQDLSTEAKADAEPVYHEFMPSGEAGNRRVEIFLEN